MSRVSDIHHINVGIRDRERTSEWYQKVFEAEPIKHPRQLELRLGSSEIHCHITPEPAYLETNHFALEIPDWEGMMAHLTAVRVPFDGDRPPGIREDTDGHYYAYLRDPDGNLIELIHHPERW
jgi:catechol 2,3-dioxygenase-like lactoylglutathione lyase family enzyme